MKNLLSLLIGILFITSCQLGDVENICELTFEERIEIYDQLEIPRDITYILPDSLALDSVSAFQELLMSDRENIEFGAFQYSVQITNCGSEADSTFLYSYGYTFYKEGGFIDLEDVSNISVRDDGSGLFTLILSFDKEIEGGYSYSNCLFNGEGEGSGEIISPDNSIYVSGLNDEESQFLATQLERLIPQFSCNPNT